MPTAKQKTKRSQPTAPRPLKRPLKEHQQEAVTAVTTGLQTHDRGQCIMACGSGKTLVAVRVRDELRPRSTVVFVPTLALARQVLDDFRRDALTPFSPLAVCSDQGVGRRRGDSDDDIATSPEELGCPVTSDPRVVHEHLARSEQPTLVVCTYPSSHVLRQIDFDLGIFDEAHRTAGEKGRLWSTALSDENVRIRKRLFLTATPRHVRVEDLGEDRPAFSMDDEATYGPVLYRLSFREAVRRGVVCDYRIVISILVDPEAEQAVEAARMKAVAVALDKAMETYGVDKAFTFHSKRSSAREFSDVLAKVSQSVGGGHPRCWGFYVDGDMGTEEREDVLAKFRRSQGGRAAVANVRCLTEGVDMPSIGMVAFIDPRKSTVDIVQAVGRAMRRSPRKTLGYVFLPVFVPAGEDVETVLRGGRFGHVFDVTHTIREVDDLFDEQVRRAMRQLLAPRENGDKQDPFSELSQLVVEAPGDYATAAVRQGLLSHIVGRLGCRKFTPDAAIQELFRLAHSGATRPPQSSRLGSFLSEITIKGSKSYRPDITIKLRDLRRDWFVDLRVKDQLAAIFHLARSGEERPKERTKLGRFLRMVTTINHTSYRPDVAAELKELRRDWFNKLKMEDKINEIFQLARSGAARPTQRSKLGKFLTDITCKGSKVYRQDITTKLRELRRDWFADLRVSDQIAEIFRLARSGAKRPDRSSKIGRFLGEITLKNSNSYRPAVAAELRELRRDWFRR